MLSLGGQPSPIKTKIPKSHTLFGCTSPLKPYPIWPHIPLKPRKGVPPGCDTYINNTKLRQKSGLKAAQFTWPSTMESMFLESSKAVA